MACLLVIGIILARLLFPEQFGLIGMLAIFMAMAQTLYPNKSIESVGPLDYDLAM